MDYASSYVVDSALSVVESCCRAFPNECEACPDYEEIRPKLEVALAGCFGLYFGPSYLVKKCKRFNWKTSDEIRR